MTLLNKRRVGKKKPNRKRNAMIDEIVDNNEVLMDQNLRVLLQRDTYKARLHVAFAFVIGEFFALCALLFVNCAYYF